MKGLKSSREWPPIAVLDMEATSWVNVFLLCHVDEIGFVKGFRSVDGYLDWLFGEWQGTHVWAHWGGHYDHRFIIYEATKRGYAWQTVMSGGAIILVTVRDRRKREIHFCDSARLLPGSVESIGKAVGLHKLDADRGNLGAQPFDDTVRYCLRDCEIILRGLQQLRDTLLDVGADFAYTLASIASRYVRRSAVLEWPLFEEEPFLSRQREADAFSEPAYAGGRVEVFRKGTFAGPLYYYDVRSSYPWSMTHDLPAYFIEFGPPDRDLERSLAEPGIHDASVLVPDNEYLPLLHVRDHGKLVFPTGLLRGRWTNLELAECLALGWQVTLHARARFKGAAFLHPFVETFYRLRQEAIESGDAFRSYAYKIALNSLYGKLVETVERKTIVFGRSKVARLRSQGARIEPTGVPGVYAACTETEGPFRHVAAGAYVTARSRVLLWKGLRRALELGGRIYYCDTDSIVTDVRLPESSDALGNWKLEATFTEAEFVAPKVYRAVADTGEEIYKVKGMPVRGLTREESRERWDSYIQGVDVQRDGISGFTADLRHGSVAPRALVLSRALRVPDTKRRHKDGDSWPVHFAPS